MFLQNFTCMQDLMDRFQISEDAVKDIDVLLAWYGYGDYCGKAFVLFKENGKLFEVHGSHCSCNGIEGQWSPEETTKDALKHFLKEGTYGYYDGEELYKIELEKVIKNLGE